MKYQVLEGGFQKDNYEVVMETDDLESAKEAAKNSEWPAFVINYLDENSNEQPNLLYVNKKWKEMVKK